MVSCSRWLLTQMVKETQGKVIPLPAVGSGPQQHRAFWVGSQENACAQQPSPPRAREGASWPHWPPGWGEAPWGLRGQTAPWPQGTSSPSGWGHRALRPSLFPIYRRLHTC